MHVAIGVRSVAGDAVLLEAEGRQHVDGVLLEVDAFRRGQQGSDDITAVVIRCVDGGGKR